LRAQEAAAHCISGGSHRMLAAACDSASNCRAAGAWQALVHASIATLPASAVASLAAAASLMRSKQ
jgi:hypothetical protein